MKPIAYRFIASTVNASSVKQTNISQNGGLHINKKLLDSRKVRMCVYQSKKQKSLYTYIVIHFAPFNNLFSTHNCLLCKNPGNESPLVTKKP